MECGKECISPVALSTQQILWCVCFITDRVLPSVGLFPNCWSCKLLDLWLCSSVLALGYNMLFLPGWEVNNELTACRRFNEKLSIQGSLLGCTCQIEVLNFYFSFTEGIQRVLPQGNSGVVAAWCL